MPIYEYKCRKCGKQFEVSQKMSEKALSRCPSCRGEVYRLISAPALQFKGTGWYVTDYARKGSTNGEKRDTEEKKEKKYTEEKKDREEKKHAREKEGDKKSGDGASASTKGGEKKTPSPAPKSSDD